MTEQLPTPPPSAGPPPSETEYIVLQHDASGSWVQELTVKARSADAAIRGFVNGASVTGEATLVAVPARSWKPVRVKPKTVTTLVIEEA